jgi:Zn-dependent protease/CBS domain-containing protein
MLQRSFSLGRLFGIEVRVHYTWLFAFLFITWSLASGYFRIQIRGQGFGTYLLLGALSALLLFGSVLVHEFSHSLVALARGLRVRNITLFIFGGVSNISGEAHTARDEFLISAVGPLTSFALALLFWLVGRGLGAAPSFDVMLGLSRPRLGAAISPAAAVFGYLTLINLVLGIFNLIPAFPLDGGRVLRSLVWGATGNFDRSTAIASTVGQAFGVVLVLFGVVRVFLGDVIGGLWTSFIGWFLTQTAGASRRERALRRILAGVTVGQVMDRVPPVVDPSTPVQSLVFDRMLGGRYRQFLVAEDGRLRGVVSTEAVNSVPREAWPYTPVERIMRTTGLVTVTPETDVGRVLELLEDDNGLLPVVQDGQIVGTVHPADVLRFAQLHAELNIGRPATRPSVP